jgi:hypothetical protein
MQISYVYICVCIYKVTYVCNSFPVCKTYALLVIKNIYNAVLYVHSPSQLKMHDWYDTVLVQLPTE